MTDRIKKSIFQKMMRWKRRKQYRTTPFYKW